MPLRRQVLLKTFVAGCGLPGDPAFGAQAMHRREDTTLNDAVLKTAPGQNPNYAGQRAVRLGEKSDLPKFVLLASAPSKLPEMQQAGSDGSQITAAHLAG